MKYYNLDYYQKSADYILEQIKEQPEIAIILGSALGSVADRLEDKISISYKNIPNMLRSTAPAHRGEYVFGKIGKKSVMVASGRFHHYEGYSYEELAQPVRIMKLLGVKTLIVTNAAGAVNLEFSVGDIMLIEDQIKLNGHSPMRGPNIDEFGPRFFDCTHIYKPALLELARERASALKLDNILRQGVYYFCPGPNFETPAEIKAIRTLGGDAVGMSTVTETLTAAHCGIDVLGISMITNMAAGITKDLQSGQDVIETGEKTADKVADLICDIVEHIDLKEKNVDDRTEDRITGVSGANHSDPKNIYENPTDKSEINSAVNINKLTTILSGNINLHINYDPSLSETTWTIDGTDEFKESLTVTQNDNELIFKSKNKLFNGFNLSFLRTSRIILNIPDQELLSLKSENSGAVDVYSTVDFKNTEITLSGTGDLNLANCGKLDLKLSGAGSFNCEKTSNAKIVISGAGDVGITHLSGKQADIKISGSGDVKIPEGDVEQLSCNIYGSGNLDAQGLKVQDADINIKGRGSVVLHSISGSLKQNSSFMGNLKILHNR